VLFCKSLLCSICKVSVNINSSKGRWTQLIAGINYVFTQKRDRRERANVRYVSLVTIVNLTA
jgi:hypothetical protein